MMESSRGKQRYEIGKRRKNKSRRERRNLCGPCLKGSK